MTEHVVELIDVALYGGMMQPIPNKIKEEIVRCRDCKYWDYDSDECTMFNCWLNCDGDGFCAWGKEESMNLGTTYIICSNCKCPIFYGENRCPDCMRPVRYSEKKNVEENVEEKKRFDLRFWKRFKH